MKKKICLSIDQMQKLKELGVETKDASMCWVRDPEGNYSLSLHDEYCYEMSFMNPVPAFTFEDMLELMPWRIFSEAHNRDFFLKMEKQQNKYSLFYRNPYLDNLVTSTFNDNAVDSAFELLCWLAENNLLKQ